jgi:hypothetical protein
MMTVDDVLYCVNCRGLEVEWRDCERHENDCYVLGCGSCGHNDYDCENQMIEREKI